MSKWRTQCVKRAEERSAAAAAAAIKPRPLLAALIGLWNLAVYVLFWGGLLWFANSDTASRWMQKLNPTSIDAIYYPDGTNVTRR